MTFTQRMLAFYLQEAAVWGWDTYRATLGPHANPEIAYRYARVAWRNAQIGLRMLEQEVQS